MILQVQHVAGTEEWRLVLQPVQKTDHGWYSCQVIIKWYNMGYFGNFSQMSAEGNFRFRRLFPSLAMAMDAFFVSSTTLTTANLQTGVNDSPLGAQDPSDGHPAGDCHPKLTSPNLT